MPSLLRCTSLCIILSPTWPAVTSWKPSIDWGLTAGCQQSHVTCHAHGTWHVACNRTAASMMVLPTAWTWMAAGSWKASYISETWAKMTNTTIGREDWAWPRGCQCHLQINKRIRNWNKIKTHTFDANFFVYSRANSSFITYFQSAEISWTDWTHYFVTYASKLANKVLFFHGVNKFASPRNLRNRQCAPPIGNWRRSFRNCCPQFLVIKSDLSM